MKTVRMKRVTIICEGALELCLEREIHDLGAKGYTFTHVQGTGVNGTRLDRWHGPNLRIEIVTSPELADRILEHVSSKYFEHYSVIALLDDVEVLREMRFAP
jgi:nitrogen regulatory protein P-II 2